MLPGKLFSHQYLLFKFPQTFLLWNWRNSFSWVGTDLCPLWNEKEGDRRGWQGLEISIPQEEYVLVPYANEAKQGHELYVPGNASYQILQSRCFPVSSLKKIDGSGNISWDNLHWNWHVSELFAEFQFSNKNSHILSWKINSYCPSCTLENKNINLDSRPHWASSQHMNSCPRVAYHYRNGTSLFPICFQAIQYLYSKIFCST